MQNIWAALLCLWSQIKAIKVKNKKVVRKSKQQDRGKINIANSADFQIERVKALQNCYFSSYINTDWGKIEVMCIPDICHFFYTDKIFGKLNLPPKTPFFLR